MSTTVQTLFTQLAQSLGLSPPAAARSFHLLFDDDLPVTVFLHADGVHVGVEAWCHDATNLVGAPRRSVLQALLRLNQVCLAGPPDRRLAIGIDSRNFIAVHGRRALLAPHGEAFADWLAWLLAQARRVRALVLAMASAGALETASVDALAAMTTECATMNGELP